MMEKNKENGFYMKIMNFSVCIACVSLCMSDID